MSLDIGTKINSLLSELPEGAVATTPWLLKIGVSPQLVSRYEASGWLHTLGYGAYVRSLEKLDWPGALYALQTQCGLDVHLGGKSALELHHALHFVPQSRNFSSLFLFKRREKKLPPWFLKYPAWATRLVVKPSTLFAAEKLGLTTYTYQSLVVGVSSPERAILELLSFVPRKQTLEEALLILEGLANLRPKLIQELLEKCDSIKVKRLFLALSKQCGHAWYKQLSLSNIDLGKGPRRIASGKKYDSEFLITVPKQQEESDE